MQRAMIFMDHMNFSIAFRDYYKSIKQDAPRLDYTLLFQEVAKTRNLQLLKSLVFAPEPDTFLMQDSSLSSTYKWLCGMANARYIDVIFGRYIARPTSTSEMSLEDRETYYKVEKGTDINLAIHALSKGFYNSYDIAIIMSGDTDYIQLYRLLKSIGKVVIVVGVGNQKLSKIIPEVDDYLWLSQKDFNNCLLAPKNK